MMKHAKIREETQNFEDFSTNISSHTRELVLYLLKYLTTSRETAGKKFEVRVSRRKNGFVRTQRMQLYQAVPNIFLSCLGQ